MWNIALTLTESSEWHAHDVFEFVFCRAGTGLLVMDQQCIELVSQRTILIEPKARHKYVFRSDESADLKIVCMTSVDVATYLSPFQISALRQMNPSEVTFTDHPNRWPKLLELLTVIPDGFNSDDRGELHVAWGAMALLLAWHFRNLIMPDNGPGKRHLSTIQKVCRWLDSHLENIGGLDEIASRFGLSRSLLTREFRRYTGTSIVDYTNTRRLQKACLILASTDQNITEAAFECGFSSLANFYRKFKVLYGVTPNEFRNLIENNR